MSDIQHALAGRYEVDRQLGRGGMATVYLAVDRVTGRQVAVKVLLPELAVTVAADRFQREVAILSKFSHPNILPLLDSGADGSFVYFVMPYAHGDSLRALLNREPQLSVDRTLAIARDIAAGLDYMHANNVVHRDIKPENVLFDEGRAVLCDFGVARAIVASTGDSISSSGLIIGTPAYMSPEQAEGHSDLDARSDIYSFACLIYEMLAGEPPFTGRTAQVVIAKQVKERPPSLGVVRPDVPADLGAALERALAKDPKARPRSGSELVTRF
ncbi:MAG: serine/threonine protein kinase [Gemmatimonadetes bacterium]|nr:serine/threonine protein kinase [Gemmatimonadota bacterium]